MRYFWAVVLGIIVFWLDIFFTASWNGSFKVSFIVLGLVAYLIRGRVDLAFILALTAALAADLLVPAPGFGARLLGFTALYGLGRFLITSFFPINRPGAVWALAFVLSLAFKLGALAYVAASYWWRGESAASLLGWGNLLNALFSSLLTMAAMAAIVYVFSRFDLLTRRFFLIRH